MMRTFELPPASARAQGRAHGEAFRGEIGSLADIRLHLCARMSGAHPDQVLAMARHHVPVLEAFDRELHDELTGIAEGAALDLSRVLVLNHYTDLRDLAMDGSRRGGATSDGCSVLYGRTPAGPVAAQTWDMHASSIPYVMMLRVPEQGGRPGAWVLSLTGCLGMAGMNQHGLALIINNLPATDAVVGPVWSAVVRRALQARGAAAARDLLLAIQHGSGRHFLVADRQAAFGIEVTGTARREVYRGHEPDYVHTNHCLDPDLASCTQVGEAATSFDRYRFLRARLDRAPLVGPDDAWQLLGSVEGYPRSVCGNMSTPEEPHGTATCAGLVLAPETGAILACAGLTHRIAPERFQA
jgi:isopenicillin-N N-acyltransferase-like protein